MEKKRKGKRKEGSDQTTEEGDEVTSLKRNSRAYQKQTSSSSEEDENNGHVTKEDNKVDTAKTTYSDIILERDYSLGILTRFSTLMPQQLKNRVRTTEAIKLHHAALPLLGRVNTNCSIKGFGGRI